MYAYTQCVYIYIYIHIYIPTHISIKEGIDADLLPLLDACVEIPQAGSAAPAQVLCVCLCFIFDTTMISCFMLCLFVCLSIY